MNALNDMLSSAQRDKRRAEAIQAHCEKEWKETGKDVVVDKALWERITKELEG